MRKLKITIISIAIISVLLLSTGCVLGESDVPLYGSQNSQLKPQSTIAVSGSGTVKATPDTVSVSINVVTEEDTSEEAVNKNSEISQQVMTAIEDTQAQDLKVETTGYNLQPLYDYGRENEPPEIYGYRVNSSVEVSTTDMEKIGDIMAEAIDAGANDIGALSFDLSQESKNKIKMDALAEATGDASRKAKAIADSLGLSLGKIYYVSESGISYPEPFYAEQAAGEIPDGRGDVRAPEISPREVEVSAYVEIIYNFN
ncbi:MAG: SIMPL domain-containing protein [Actinomycetota bacterium]|nr:SIMPL domain-containing protein [Actinomycetota bacterium]